MIIVLQGLTTLATRNVRADVIEDVLKGFGGVREDSFLFLVFTVQKVDGTQ